MTRTLTILFVIPALTLLAAPAVADWDYGDPFKYVQRPDLDGWDVDFTVPPPDVGTPMKGRLADDFPCYETGPITDVHLWFSVQGDEIMGPDGTAVTPMEAIDRIHLSFHKNILPGEGPQGQPWSMPGHLEWERDFVNDAASGSLVIREWYETGQQGWFEPPFEFAPNDHQRIWQANIFIDPLDAFWQEGTTDQPQTYWLDASISLKPNHIGKVGWKTSTDHWEDDAVYQGDGTFGPGWYELRDPVNPDVSLDLAFVITPEPGTVIMLLGAGLTLALTCMWRRRRR